MKSNRTEREYQFAIVMAWRELKRAGYTNGKVSRLFGIPWITIYKWHQMFKDPAMEKMKRNDYAKERRRRARRLKELRKSISH
jgi:hypothetical protein